MGFLPYSLEFENIILSNITKETEKEFFLNIINRFKEEGLPIKVKLMFPKKPSVSYYRVFCYIKKSLDAVVLDAKKDSDLNIYLRIENQKTFDRLSEFTGNICNQILNAKNCNIIILPKEHKCEENRYVFTFNDRKYIKCKQISSNFKFNDISKKDSKDIIDIINGEIEYMMNKK